MPDPVSVRPVQSGDEFSLQTNCLPAATLQQVREQVRWAQDEAAPRRLAMLVAVKGDEVIGTATLQPDPSIVARDPQGRLRLVTPDDLTGHRVALARASPLSADDAGTAAGELSLETPSVRHTASTARCGSGWPAKPVTR